MNIDNEVNRLAGCQDMDSATFREEVRMALENAYQAGKNYRGPEMHKDDKYNIKGE